MGKNISTYATVRFAKTQKYAIFLQAMCTVPIKEINKEDERSEYIGNGYNIYIFLKVNQNIVKQKEILPQILLLQFFATKFCRK